MEMKVRHYFIISISTIFPSFIETLIILRINRTTDEKMHIPQRHIPSRFVVPIPPEFNTAKQSNEKNSKKAKYKSSQPSLQVDKSPSGQEQIDVAISAPEEDSIMIGLQNSDVLQLNNGEFEW